MKINLYFCLAVAVILGFCFLGLYHLYLRTKKRYAMLQESYRRLEQLNTQLRRQRHDYLNHMQVVYGMVQLEEYEQLSDYLKPVYEDLMKTGKALKTAVPALNALICAKMAEAEAQKIAFFVEVQSDLAGIAIESWELCRVLSNLLDNAMTALLEKQDERRLYLHITEDKESYDFIVSDNGPGIPKELQKDIFRQGFTTKKEAQGHGLGLAIVADVLKRSHGTVEVTSQDGMTAFAVKLPKEKKA